ncbi:hypothetical protein BV22DRAFT_318887 [Leucogyrophana mollusca]|uniref:Uncharacterized protein n=1 Tax=Leucogyrophana mollusca TaxID=85980 RepID=A0ACB8BMP5_9AGAM|nr:hypothetical protein BV22DRAFT_318887 [Leucogyrophana mollusca]
MSTSMIAAVNQLWPTDKGSKEETGADVKYIVDVRCSRDTTRALILRGRFVLVRVAPSWIMGRTMQTCIMGTILGVGLIATQR